MKKKNLVQFVVSPDRSNKVAEFKKGVQMRRSFYLLNILWNGRNKHKKKHENDDVQTFVAFAVYEKYIKCLPTIKSSAVFIV